MRVVACGLNNAIFVVDTSIKTKISNWDGADKLEDAKTLQEELISPLKASVMELHKWSSNEPSFLQSIKTRSNQVSFDKFSYGAIKTLGLSWNALPLKQILLLVRLSREIYPSTNSCESDCLIVGGFSTNSYHSYQGLAIAKPLSIPRLELCGSELL
ncbi:hypothetical protein TNCT_140871 [Trichonephila clavata]|uniref:Uncharacterized protein n=1 Tax=Trichonephila clavata TaxID=2740835 RepID=A0A8X6M3D9_TRICU|nr:hypothetical protein TNCT_140871 [Trichonephila clavata]